jgi:hypothetical protein
LRVRNVAYLPLNGVEIVIRAIDDNTHTSGDDCPE